jgi:hypothetical protein
MANAIIPGVDAEGSASRREWHSAVQIAISGPGSNFLRLQQLIGQLQTFSPASPHRGFWSWTSSNCRALLRNG